MILPYLPFDYAQARPFDYAQDSPFDYAQDRPFDYGSRYALHKERSGLPDPPLTCAYYRTVQAGRRNHGFFYLCNKALVTRLSLNDRLKTGIDKTQ
jgi:hypothetical protein